MPLAAFRNVFLKKVKFFLCKVLQVSKKCVPLQQKVTGVAQEPSTIAKDGVQKGMARGQRRRFAESVDFKIKSNFH